MTDPVFADRTAWDLSPNALSRERERLRRSGEPWIDLTESNPTRAGFRYPQRLLEPLADPGSLAYDPDPRGLPAAREAVCRLFGTKGVRLDPAQVFLTASTSEAYSFLFRLLVDPGDKLLVPRPSYPLFDYLAALHDARPAPYRLRAGAGGWRLDLASLEEAADNAKALVAVHPNNPTGSCFDHRERESVLRFCAARGLPLISDEVFAEYRYGDRPEAPLSLAGSDGALTFTLGGISKLLALPQMKLAWIAVTGPHALVKESCGRLEVIADTFLSVNTPVQRAFPGWLNSLADIQAQILDRVRGNREVLRRCLPAGARLFGADGGWSAVLQLDGVRDEEQWLLGKLRETRVAAHPGYFFEFEQEGIIVVSLLPEPPVFKAGVSRLLGVTMNHE